MAKTTFSGPVVSENGFEGAFISTSVQLQSNNSNSITLDAPNSLAASYTLLLPPDDGSNGQVLTTDGSGVTTWTTNGAGTVTSVAALTLDTTGTDVSSTVATGTTTPVITLNIPTASATNRGALSSTDWTTFNNKGSGTVTSVAGTGTTNGLSLSGTVTSTGNITLGGNFALIADTAANLADITNAINTAGKYTGKMVVVLANGLIYTASGALDSSVWYASDGTTSATPI
jgi:hypothetical protein